MYEKGERLITESIEQLESNELLVESQKEAYFKL